MANYGIFKPYDVRGKYPQEINEKIIIKIISSLILKFKRKNKKLKIIIGRDCRLSSLSLYEAAIKTIKRTLTVDNYDLRAADLITTPMLSFLTSHFNADFGIMVTASHNPKEYNGLKIVGENAIPINGKEILKFMNFKIKKLSSNKK